MISKRKYRRSLKAFVATCFAFLIILNANAQRVRKPVPERDRTVSPESNSNLPQQQQQGKDTIGGFVRRNDAADSITITYRLLDSLRTTP